MTTPTAAAPLPQTPFSADGPIQASLRAARRRLVTQRFLDVQALCILAAACLLVLFYGLLCAMPYFQGFSWFQTVAPWAVPVAASILVAGLIRAAVGWPSLARTAVLLDQRAGTHDRFHTALVFAARGERSPLEELTLAECSRFAENFPVRRWTPFRAPRALRYIAVPLILGGTLLAYTHFYPYRAPRPTALDGAVARQADDLKKLADAVRQKSPDAKLPDLEKLAEEMKKSAQRLKETTGQPDPEKLKSALRELSSLEAMLRAMKDAARENRSSPEEMVALTAALAANEQTRAAAEALKSGDPTQAGAELEKLLQQLQRNGDAAQTLQQLAQSMQEQAAKLSEQQKNEVAQQMQQAAQAAQSGQSELSQKSLERLAQLLQRMGANKNNGKNQQQKQASGGKSGSGSPMTQQQLDQLISALENMKEGLQPGEGQQPGSGQDDKSGDGKSLALVDSFAKSGDNPGPGVNPSGQPGSELDQGHSDKIFDEKTAAAAPKAGVSKRLEGLPGEGESLQELVNTSGDASKAGRAYRQLYDAAAPAAQDAVEQENIPLGSRRFVRRYFENIRPQN